MTSNAIPKKKRRRGLFLLRLIIIAGLMAVLVIASGCSSTPDGASSTTRVTVFASPTCECCGAWSGYLKEHGLQVKTRYIEDMPSIKARYQIPEAMVSCHTAVIGNYFVEGHVPIEAIEKLLEERPDIDGIALPGMPSGSPGMSGQQTETFTIYAISNGRASEFMTIRN